MDTKLMLISSLPRLTRYLRSFSFLDGSRSAHLTESKKRNCLEFKLRCSKWFELLKEVEKEQGHKSEAMEVLKSLYKLAKDLLSSEEGSVDALEESALFMLEVFLDASHVSNRHVSQLKSLFGSVSYSMAERGLLLVTKLRSLLSEELWKSLNEPEKKCSQKKKRKMWRPSNSIQPPRKWTPPDTSFLSPVLEPSDGVSAFSMAYKEVTPTTSGSDKKKSFDKEWLIAELKTQTRDSSLSPEEFAESLLHLLKSSKSNDELQNDLFDLLGFDSFSLIGSLLERRKQLVEEEIKNVEKKLVETSQPKISPAPLPPVLKERQTFRDKYPHVYDAVLQAKLQAGYFNGIKMMLPEDVQRKDTKSHEEVVIPPFDPGSVPREVNMKEKIRISNLDEVGRTVFAETQSLNLIQSLVFETAYNTNENLLICAPTGAGKTNVALLTIVNTIKHHIHNDVIMKDSFKIVYVAPMKALAAEMTANFSKKLAPLGIQVRELSGDMQLTKSEILQTQILVTTPEKWDVVTRKGTGDVALTKIVKLLIIDEVHLLHGDRGPVIEALVARTLRQVETSQSMIRIVGLSATLPNYLDVSRFLRVNPQTGLFFFDSRFRPVPLCQTFIGVKATKSLQQMADMDTICYEKTYEMVRAGHQVMVFVHARNATIRTANVLVEMAQGKGHLMEFQPQKGPPLSKTRSKELGELFGKGFAVHHAGLLRSDRSLVERYFSAGLVKVLICTSTLAWGVNLPAHAVIIRGTEIYDAKHGTFVDLGILDVLQIFGRAGRPQFDSSGEGTIITSHSKLPHYLSLLTNQLPIESNFVNCLADNLNAEISLGTISNLDEAVRWLSYTYLYVRARINPQVYGTTYQTVIDDPNLDDWRREILDAAAKALDRAKMVRYNSRTGDLSITDLGRTASNYYIKYDTVEVINTMMSAVMSESELLNLVSHAQEFQQLKVREDEMEELGGLMNSCEFEVGGGKENLHGKVNILMQSFLSRNRVSSFSLVSDLSYIVQNAVRILRALFEISLRGNNALLAGRLLQMALMMEKQQWYWESPLRQLGNLGEGVVEKLDKLDLGVDGIREMDSKELGSLLRNPKLGPVVRRCAYEVPYLELSATLHPITRTVLKVKVTVTPDFRWNDKVHGKAESFWLWIEEPQENNIYHSEFFLLTKKQVVKKQSQELILTMPLVEPLPPQYIMRVSSDRWLGASFVLPISVQGLILPEQHPPHTELLNLQPLPVTALSNPLFQSLYKFTHFNPIQTQIFHCLYHTDGNVLLGSPTGSGKTIVAEIAMLRVFATNPGGKVVYVAPLKALVREKMEDWSNRFGRKLSLNVVELTGDTTPDMQAINTSDIIVTTPEKWDGISRSWQNRTYVQKVALLILDEVHLLGEERGPVLEVIVSRTNFIRAHTLKPLRIVALSTALANARDLANWLGIKDFGLFNFRPSVRPVPLEVHINGFPGKHYCPRMATMNKPTFQAICLHSPSQPVLVFVSSRRQTRLTALDLIAYLAENNPKQWLHTSEEEMDQIIQSIRDNNLKLTLAFGIGLHHAGLSDRDRKTVEELFLNTKIQVLIATSTLAWGVNLPAHLVIVKGTEYYDGKSKRYVDMPITDVLQMMGRAGRPQFDTQGVAVILVQDVKKNFYRKFLYEPFPVESSLLSVIADHLNAEVVAGTVATRQEALDYLTWTYFFRRLIQNPAYYGMESTEPKEFNRFLTHLIDRNLQELYDAGCIVLDEDGRGLGSTSMGRIAAFYYLSHQTMAYLQESLKPDLSLEQCINVLSRVHEFSLLPVRHNEEILNGELAQKVPLPVEELQLDSSHVKTNLLLQAHFSRLELPVTDYITDLKSVLDQTLRVLQGMIDVSGESGWLSLTLRLHNLLQMSVQGLWMPHSPFLVLPHVETWMVDSFHRRCTFPGAVHLSSKGYPPLRSIFSPELDETQISQVYDVLRSFPRLRVSWKLSLNSDTIPSPTNELAVYAGEEYVLDISLQRSNKPSDRYAFTPKYHKPKTEGWCLILGDIEKNEVLALRRVIGPSFKASAHLTFQLPIITGEKILTLYVMSDTYLGLDQQYEIRLNVLQLPLELKAKEYSLFL